MKRVSGRWRNSAFIILFTLLITTALLSGRIRSGTPLLERDDEDDGHLERTVLCHDVVIFFVFFHHVIEANAFDEDEDEREQQQTLAKKYLNNRSVIINDKGERKRD